MGTVDCVSPAPALSNIISITEQGLERGMPSTLKTIPTGRRPIGRRVDDCILIKSGLDLLPQRTQLFGVGFCCLSGLGYFSLYRHQSSWFIACGDVSTLGA